jgi:hypothetical protein
VGVQGCHAHGVEPDDAPTLQGMVTSSEVAFGNARLPLRLIPRDTGVELDGRLYILRFWLRRDVLRGENVASIGR